VAAISYTNGINNLPISNQISTPTSIISPSSKVYLGSGSTDLPGIANLFFAPYEFFLSMKALLSAEKINDGEGILQNGLRVISTPFSFINSVSKLVWYIFEGGIYFKLISAAYQHTLLPLTWSIAGLGFIVCAIEGVIESIGLYRSKKFYNQFYPQENEEKIYLTKLQQLSNRFLKISPEEQQKIHDYVQRKPLSVEKQKLEEKMMAAKLTTKKNDLIRRVHPWLADEIEQTVPGTLQNLQSSDPTKRGEAKDKAAEIFQKMRLQSQKKILIHTIGLAAVLVTTIGLILGCFPFPFLIPLAVLLVGGALSVARQLLHAGFMDSKGWEFNVENCIPSTVKRIYHKIFSLEKKEKPRECYPITLQFEIPKRREEPRRKTLDFTLTVPPGIRI
jgi:hypothetical protein